MDSNFLLKNGFKNFGYFEFDNFKKNINQNCLNTTGLYILILSKKFNRLIGETDILYIGHSGGAKNGKGRYIFKRLEDYCIGSKSAPQDKRIHDSIERLMREDNKITILYNEIEKDRCKKEESELLKKFSEEHIELPPLNKQS